MRYFCVIIVMACFLQGCSPSSLEDFRQEGQSVERALIKEMQKIHSREQLVAAQPRLSWLFEKLVKVIIEGRDWRDNHPLMEEFPLSNADKRLSDVLRAELIRLYQLEGGRDLVEQCQRKALNRLDAFEQRRTRRRQ